jgi:hypothetical protein
MSVRKVADNVRDLDLFTFILDGKTRDQPQAKKPGR